MSTHTGTVLDHADMDYLGLRQHPTATAVWGADFSGVPEVRWVRAGSTVALVRDQTHVFDDGPTASVCARCGALTVGDSRIDHDNRRKAHTH